MRTSKSIKNIISVVFFNLLIGVLGFIKVKVFVAGLSDEIYSLNQLFFQIFSYIAIADAGFGLILNKHLYNAFAKEDKEEIINIYSTSKKFYNNIGVLMLVAALIISFFVKYMTKANISGWYIQLVCIIFMIRNIIDYFFVAPRYVMEANQNAYKINYLVKSIKIIESIIEIVLVYIGVNYLLILLPGIAITIVIDVYISKLVAKDYSWLKNNGKFNKKYLKGTKDLIYLKLSGIMNSNTDIILLSTFINPVSVIIYTSYSYVTKFISDTVYIVASAVTPSYANVLFKESDDKKYSIFCELNILFLFIGSFAFIMLYGFLNNLIIIWIGEKYLTTSFALCLFCYVLFHSISIRAITMTINSLGLFKETKVATILEAVTNLIISVVLVHKYKIIGVLLGTIISALITTFIQNAVYIYKNIFKKSCLKYFTIYFIVLAINILFILGFNYISLPIKDMLSFILFVLGFSIIVAAILFGIYYILFDSFKALTARLINILKKNKYFRRTKEI